MKGLRRRQETTTTGFSSQQQLLSAALYQPRRLPGLKGPQRPVHPQLTGENSYWAPWVLPSEAVLSKAAQGHDNLAVRTHLGKMLVSTWCGLCVWVVLFPLCLLGWRCLYQCWCGGPRTLQPLGSSWLLGASDASLTPMQHPLWCPGDHLKNIYVYAFLALLGLSCGTQDL